MKQPKKNRTAMSRMTRRLVIFLFLLAAAVVGMLDHRFGEPLREQISRWGPDWHDWKTYHAKSFHVIHVIDGDTIDLDHPDGDQPYTRIRLMGVDTPEIAHNVNEISMYFGQEATLFTTDLTLDTEVMLFLDDVGDIRGRYGRLLAYVQLSDGSILNAHLIEHGYGYAYTLFNHSRQKEYIQLQKEAIEHHRGLWKNAKSQDFPRWLRRDADGVQFYESH